MEVCEGDSPFSSVLTTEELQSIPTEVRKKVSSFVTEKFDELITNNALLETTKFNTGTLNPLISYNILINLHLLFL